MTDFEKAIRDLNQVIDHYHDERDTHGAVPMPLSTVKESLNALTLKDDVFTLLDGFEVNADRAQKRLDHCLEELFPLNKLPSLDYDTLKVVFNIAELLIKQYYLTCSKRHHNGNKRNY